MDKRTKLPQQFQICQTCEELFDDGKYYVSTLDYNKLKSINEGLVEALKRSHACATVKDDGSCEGCFVSEALKAADGEGVK